MRLVLARRRPKAAPDRLHEQDFRLRRLRVDDAADVTVKASRQRADVADDAGRAGVEAPEDALALGIVGETIYVFGGDASFDETLLKMLGMGAVDAVASVGRSSPRADPCGDDVADKRRGIACLRPSSP